MARATLGKAYQEDQIPYLERLGDYWGELCASPEVASSWAGRYEDLLGLLEMAPHDMWHYRQYGVKALAAMGRSAEAVRYAKSHQGLNDNPEAVARACEDVLLSSGLADEFIADAQAGRAVGQTLTHSPVGI